jgi:hypothetical protein
MGALKMAHAFCHDGTLGLEKCPQEEGEIQKVMRDDSCGAALGRTWVFVDSCFLA